MSPAADVFGNVSLTVSVVDGTYTVSQTVELQVTPVNDNPVISVRSLSLVEEEETGALFGIVDVSDVDSTNVSCTVSVENMTLTYGSEVGAGDVIVSGLVGAVNHGYRLHRSGTSPAFPRDCPCLCRMW